MTGALGVDLLRVGKSPQNVVPVRGKSAEPFRAAGGLPSKTKDEPSKTLWAIVF
jgi:hypothetical protein